MTLWSVQGYGLVLNPFGTLKFTRRIFEESIFYRYVNDSIIGNISTYVSKRASTAVINVGESLFKSCYF